MKKILGILGLLLVICFVTALNSDSFMKPGNISNLASRTGLYGILGIGVAFVIITGGIDLSVGSIVGLTGTMLPWLLVKKGWSLTSVLGLIALVSVCIGLLHGLLVTRLKLQPFLVTLCGLLIYRGAARYLTDDLNQGFGTGHTELRELTTGPMGSMSSLLTVVGAVLTMWLLARWLRTRTGPFMAGGLRAVSRSWIATLRGLRSRAGFVAGLKRCPAWLQSRALLVGLVSSTLVLVVGGVTWLTGRTLLAEVPVPMPFWVLVALALVSGLLLNETVFGRHLLATGRNEQAARFSGVRTGLIITVAYVLCAVLAGLGGVLFTLDANGVQPSQLGQFYELYAIAAAVLGGCSLRGGEGSILGIVIGTAVLRLLYNAFNLLGIPYSVEYAVMGTVILLGVLADEVIRRIVAKRRRASG